MTAYEELEARFRRITNLRHAVSLLQWDLATMMPEGGREARAEELATLRVLAHEMLTDARVPELLDAAEPDAKALGPWQRANLGEMRRVWLHASALEARLVEAVSRANATAEAAWRAARPRSDFAMIRPHLEKVLALTREVAEAKAARLGTTPYDALLDEWSRAAAAPRSTGSSSPWRPSSALSSRRSSSTRPRRRPRMRPQDHSPSNGSARSARS